MIRSHQCTCVVLPALLAYERAVQFDLTQAEMMIARFIDVGHHDSEAPVRVRRRVGVDRPCRSGERRRSEGGVAYVLAQCHPLRAIETALHHPAARWSPHSYAATTPGERVMREVQPERLTALQVDAHPAEVPIQCLECARASRGQLSACTDLGRGCTHLEQLRERRIRPWGSAATRSEVGHHTVRVHVTHVCESHARWKIRKGHD
jgi:hypothetical protein